MKRFSSLCPVVAILLFAVASLGPAAAADRVLQPGVPFNTTLPARTFAMDLYVEVPAGAERLTVAITGADMDLDLYVKYGRQVIGTGYEEWDADADFLADGPTGNETITVTASSSPPLSPGMWYIGTLNWGASTASFTVTALVEGGAPVLGVSRTAVDFGEVQAGGMELRSLTVENTGAGTLEIGAMPMSGPDAGEFGALTDCTSLAAGESCEIQLAFMPNGTGPRSAAIEIRSSAPENSTATVFLSGTAVSGEAPAIMPVPRGQEVFPYRILRPAARSALAATARPVRVGSCSPGAEGLDLGLVLNAFTAPVDVYVGVYAPDLDPSTVFVLLPDGRFQPHTAGLAAWRSGLTVPVDETFLTGIDTARLPEGDYQILAAVTPAGRLDAFYMWQAFLTVPGACAPAPVPEGSAGYVRGEVVVPGATLVLGGKAYEGSAAVSGNALVGLVKDGKAYFYHPALGHTELSEETSRLAVGHFLAGTEAGAGAEGKAVTGSKAIAPGGSIHLATGLALDHPAAGTLSVTNHYGRWAAVRDAEETVLGSRKYFLGPRGSLLPTNVPEMIERAWTENYLGVFTRNLGYSPPLTLQSYGSVIRSLPGVFLGLGWEGFDQACENDPWLFARVNAVDAIQLVGDGVQHIFAVAMPEECLEAFFSDIGIEALKDFFIFLTTVDESGWGGSMAEIPAAVAFKNWFYNTVNGAGKCAAIAASAPFLPAALAEEVLAEFLDIVALLKWTVVDTLFGVNQIIFNTAAYDEVTIAEIEIGNCQVSGDLKVNEEGQVTFSCVATGADRVTVDFGGMAGETGHALAFNPASGIWSATAAVYPVLEGRRTATFTAWNSSGQYERCEAGIDVAGSFSIRDCTLTPLEGDLYAGRYSSVNLSCTVDGPPAGNVTADLTALGGLREVFLSRGENGAWSGQSGVNPDAPGYFTVMFSASDAAQRAVYGLTVTVNDPNEQSSVAFTDPSGAWTVTLTFPEGQAGWAEVVVDRNAYNTDQVVKVFLNGMPADPRAWDRIPVEIAVAHPNLKSWNLYSNPGISDPTRSTLLTSTTAEPVRLWAQDYYWMNLYPQSGSYSAVIFRLYGTL